MIYDKEHIPFLYSSCYVDRINRVCFSGCIFLASSSKMICFWKDGGHGIVSQTGIYICWECRKTKKRIVLQVRKRIDLKNVKKVHSQKFSKLKL